MRSNRHSIGSSGPVSTTPPSRATMLVALDPHDSEAKVGGTWVDANHYLHVS